MPETPTPPGHAVALTREVAARGLEQARGRTHGLTEVEEPELLAQHSRLMSPLVWDLAHIGQQEDLWLLRGGDSARQGLLSCQVEKLYDAFEHPRAERVDLPLLPPAEARAYIADVRGRVLDSLDRVREDDPEALFPFVMVEQHEQQHVETMLATHQLRRGVRCWARGPRCPQAVRCRTTPCSCPPARSCWASTPPPTPGRSTTSGRRTWSTSPPSASAGCR